MTDAFNLVHYLAGPMTGLPEQNYPAFDRACRFLRKRKYRVLSPHEIEYDEGGVRGSLPYEVYIQGGLQLMAHCNSIIFLQGWVQSSGAKIEFGTASAQKWPMFYFDETLGLIDMNHPSL